MRWGDGFSLRYAVGGVHAWRDYAKPDEITKEYPTEPPNIPARTHENILRISPGKYWSTRLRTGYPLLNDVHLVAFWLALVGSPCFFRGHLEEPKVRDLTDSQVPVRLRPVPVADPAEKRGRNRKLYKPPLW